MPNYVEHMTIGPLNYAIEKRGKRYHLWLGGCGIGRPCADKPGDISAYSAAKISDARNEIKADAKERLEAKIQSVSIELKLLQKALASITDDSR